MNPLVEKMCREEVPFEEVVASWSQLDFGLLDEMSATEQDPEWHAEGNVATHTAMVLAEAYNELLDDAMDLDESRRRILLLAAVLHDIAKPITTVRREIGGRERVVSPRHAERGRSWLVYRLGHLGISAREIAGVLGLVGFHHHPRKLVADDQPAYFWRRLAREADVRLLYHLERADIRGRKHENRENELEVLELFRLECEQLGIWNNDNPWRDWEEALEAELTLLPPERRSRAVSLIVSEGERGSSLAPWNAWMRTHEIRESSKTFTLLVGVSGSGKTTWVHQLPSDTVVVSLDEIRTEVSGNPSDQKHNGRVIQLAKERLREALRQECNIVWEGTNLREDQRRMLIGLAEDYGAFTQIVGFQTMTGILRRRNDMREKPVPANILERQIERIQWPTVDEAHEFRVLFSDSLAE